MKRFLKKHWLTIVIGLVFIVGLAILIYPAVSDYFISRAQSRVVATYREAVERLNPIDIDGMVEAAHEYNERLLTKIYRYALSEEELEEYYSMLRVDESRTGPSVIGSLEIDFLNILLPIYHGTSEEVLNIAAGHFEGTSLPVGGPATHSVITGHTGLPSSKLLTDIDRMEIGDVFTVHVLNETLSYMVDRLVIVDPGDFGPLDIEPGMDYCTLLTCYPYGVNSHRLLVRGVRITPEEAAVAVRRVIPTEAIKIGEGFAALFVVTPVLIILIVVKFILYLRKSR